MGKGRRKFDRRKNYELALKLRIPLELLKPFVVSLPLSAYSNAVPPSGQALVERLVATHQAPVGWSVLSPSTIYKVKCNQPDGRAVVTYSLTVHTDLTWSLTVGAIPILQRLIPAVPSRLLHYQHLVSLLLTLDGSKLCVGNPDEKYMSLIKGHHGNLHDQTGTKLCYA